MFKLYKIFVSIINNFIWFFYAITLIYLWYSSTCYKTIITYNVPIYNFETFKFNQNEFLWLFLKYIFQCTQRFNTGLFRVLTFKSL